MPAPAKEIVASPAPISLPKIRVLITIIVKIRIGELLVTWNKPNHAGKNIKVSR
jgi:hypothetical protein